jgi:oligosaccharide repeat unit polymerase
MKQYLAAYGVFIILSLLGFGAILSSESLIYSTFIFTVYSFILLYMNLAEDLLSPLNWFLPFNFIYSAIYPMYLSYFDLIDIYSNDLILCSFIAAFSFALVTLEPKGKPILDIPSEQSNYCRVSLIAIFICALPVLLSLFTAVSLDITSKREFIDISRINPILGLIAFVYPLTFMFIVHLLKNMENMGKFKLTGTFYAVLILFLGIFALTGERDNVFRLLLCVFFIYYSFVKVYKKYYLFLGLIGVLFILPITQIFKGFLITGISFDVINTLAMKEVLFGEFSASSRNIHTLYIYGWDMQYGMDIVHNILKSIPFVGSDLESSTNWFNRVYRVQHGIDGTSGWGFSLIGQGLINFGLFGVFLVFSLLGVTTRLLRRLSFKGKLYTAFYIYFITMAIYGLRADISNILSQGIKNGLIALVILIMISKIYTGLSYEKKL